MDQSKNQKSTKNNNHKEIINEIINENIKKSKIISEKDEIISEKDEIINEEKIISEKDEIIDEKENPKINPLKNVKYDCLNYDMLEKCMNDYGFKLLTNRDDFKNKALFHIKYICSCETKNASIDKKHIVDKTLRGIKGDMRCKNCQKGKVDYTCISCGTIRTVGKYNVPPKKICFNCVPKEKKYKSYCELNKILNNNGTNVLTEFEAFYEGNMKSIEFICTDCGVKTSKTTSTLQQKLESICHSCSAFRAAEKMNKPDYFKTVLEPLFSQKDLTLITKFSEFENKNSILTYECKFHHINQIICRNKNSLSACKDCSIVENIKFDKVKKKFDDLGLKLLTKRSEFKNQDTKLTYICGGCKGKECTTTWKGARISSWKGKCQSCSSDNMRIPYEDIKKIFSESGCKLISTKYENNKTLLDYICICGQQGSTNIKNFSTGQRCGKSNCKTARMEQTLMKTMGVTNVMHNPTIFKKATENNKKNQKEFIFPSGKKVNVRGYEHLYLKELIEKGYDENDIIVDPEQMPIVAYKNMKDNKKIYYPDIYIKSKNKFIEVKSEFIHSKNELNDCLKWDATRWCYDLDVVFYDKRGKKDKIIKYSKFN